MKRIVIVGCPGAGKTTLAQHLAADLRLPHIEFDSLYHQPDWQPAPMEDFRARLDAAMEAAPDGWVTCGNYERATEGRHVDAADTIVWIDLSRRTIMSRVVRRTLRRAITREELWNGNREPLSNLYSWDPESNIIRWAWVMWPKYRVQFEAKASDGSWSHLDVRRLRNRSEVREFAASVTR